MSPDTSDKIEDRIQRLIDRLPETELRAAERAVKKVERFAETEHGDVKKLKGLEDRYRVRVGDWRVIFRYLREQEAVAVLRVRPRGSAYR